MSDDNAQSAAGEKGGKGGGGGRLLGLLLPALIAGAASFGGAKVAGANHAAPAASDKKGDESKPPGPTLALDPFLCTVPDANKKVHPMKVSLAIEFEAGAKEAKGEEGFKVLTPRVRDSTLSYMRTLTYEEALDPSASDTMRAEILKRVKESGAPGAEKVLITDFVVQ